ncbi:response regulator transcription factor [Angustibacter sp. Root456]|uniref:response regulator n=1 Tax=Angustibacter sp. Root456 TaxID=1736539 RepID=UPI0006F68EBF|nr:response regulator transcription factor [Angustibacter sp. Root456]KQX69770.1 LuxR family transcriptional regulator [Angustibacter sp. Root456]
MIRVVIADDQALVRSGFGAILSSEDDIEVAGEAGTGDEATELVARTSPDVVLMDVRMPGSNGIEATRRITTAHRAKVVMLTTFDVDEHVYDAFRAGASGFLLKTVSPEYLVHAVRAAHCGETLLAPAITRRVVERFTAAPRPGDGRRLERLTDRELQVLRLVALGLSNDEIASRLYLSAGTVKTHVGRILAKYDLRDRVQAVVLAYETGVVQPGSAREE